MKTKELTVPAEVVVEVAKRLLESEISNEIVGTTEGEEIIIEVTYDRDKRHVISEIKELIESSYEFNDQDED